MHVTHSMGDLTAFTGLKALVLDADGNDFTDDDFRTLVSLTSLETLCITAHRNIDPWLVQFHGLPKLAYLSVKYLSSDDQPDFGSVVFDLYDSSHGREEMEGKLPYLEIERIAREEDYS
jgi:hypothetical protein